MMPPEEGDHGPAGSCAASSDADRALPSNMLNAGAAREAELAEELVGLMKK